MSEVEFKHWSEVIAERAIERFGDDHIVCSGWSPSGDYHIGNSREAVTCSAINRSLRKLGKNSKFVFVIDDFDPLDKIPSNLGKYTKELKPYLGHPLNRVPDVTGEYSNYAEHFASGAIKAMSDFGFDVEFVYSSKHYAEGKYDEYLHKFRSQKEEIDKLFEEISGSSLNSIVQVICQECGSMKNPIILNVTKDTISYKCQPRDKQYEGCDNSGEIKISSHEWKLKWRLDWPARQTFLGVTVEPSGADHSNQGGSVDTALAVHEKILKQDSPILERFSFITLEGGKKASGSRGGALPAGQIADVMPVSAFLYLIYRYDLMREIEFNPNSSEYGKLIDEFDDARRMNLGVKFEGRDNEIMKLSTASELAMVEKERNFIPASVGFDELCLVYQTSLKNEEKTIEKLENMGKIESNQAKSELKKRLQLVNVWLDEMAPESMKIEFLEELPDGIEKHWSPKVIETWKSALSQVQEETSADDFTLILRESAEEQELSPKEYYGPFYQMVSGKNSGPNASNLVLALGAQYLLDKIESIENLSR